MFIDFKRYKRNSLTQDQKEFLHVLVPFGRMVQDQTKLKALLAGIKSKNGIASSIICSEAIIKSNWNRHKIAEKYNNLTLLESDEYCGIKGKEFEGKRYRYYDSWLDFSVDLSDYYVFSGLYQEVLLARNLDEQIDLISLINPTNDKYCDMMLSLIESLGLWEFDY